jgi:hypothetical protein
MSVFGPEMKYELQMWLHVHVQCEACGTCYWYAAKDFTAKYKTFRAKAPPESKIQAALAEDVSSQAKKASERGKLGHRRCPKCGFIQSWMRRAFLWNCVWLPPTIIGGLTIVASVILDALDKSMPGWLMLVAFTFVPVSAMGGYIAGRWFLAKQDRTMGPASPRTPLATRLANTPQAMEPPTST